MGTPYKVSDTIPELELEIPVSELDETTASLELGTLAELLSAAFSLELDSAELLELDTSELDETGILPELLSSGLPQPSGGQTTPYAG